jgi:predicted nucleic acid-binding Zn ribbon protein
MVRDEPPVGPDAVDEAWRRTVAAARARGSRPGDPAPRRAGARGLGSCGSGAGPGPRDPQRLGDLAAGIVHEAGWEDRIGVAGVMGRWAEVVGEDVAARCTPERFTDGVLVVRAVTTAWATQLSYLAGDLRGRLAAVVGEGVVHRIEVLGPAGPSWRRGRLRVTGTRGPRDTYG